MRAREAAAARGRDAAAAASAIHAENLQELQTLRTPEELAADAAADLHDMITGASASQQAARARAKTRALREKERQQRDHDEKAAKQAKQRASARERMQKLRNNEAFRELEVRCYTHNACLLFQNAAQRERLMDLNHEFLFAVSERSRAVSEKEQKQRDHYEKAAKLAKKRAADRERKQKLRNNEAFRDLEVRCYLCARTQSVF